MEIVVTGEDDNEVDFDVVYTILTSGGISNDSNYNGVDVADVQMINMDNDIPAAGVTVDTTTLQTSESGTTDTFNVKLVSPPTDDVTIILVSADTSEGMILGLNLLFTADNWDQWQPVTIQGQDDADLDGDVTYDILTSGTISNDPRYDGLNVPDVSVTNEDNEFTAMIFEGSSGGSQRAVDALTGVCEFNHNISFDMTITITGGNGLANDPFVGTIDFSGDDTAPNVGGPNWCNDVIGGSMELTSAPFDANLRQLFVGPPPVPTTAVDLFGDPTTVLLGFDGLLNQALTTLTATATIVIPEANVDLDIGITLNPIN